MEESRLTYSQLSTDSSSMAYFDDSYVWRKDCFVVEKTVFDATCRYPDRHPQFVPYQGHDLVTSELLLQRIFPQAAIRTTLLERACAGQLRLRKRLHIFTRKRTCGMTCTSEMCLSQMIVCDFANITSPTP